MQLFSVNATILKKNAHEKLKKATLKKSLGNTKIDFYPYFSELPQWLKLKNSCSKMCLID